MRFAGPSQSKQGANAKSAELFQEPPRRVTQATDPHTFVLAQAAKSPSQSRPKKKQRP